MCPIAAYLQEPLRWQEKVSRVSRCCSGLKYTIISIQGAFHVPQQCSFPAQVSTLCLFLAVLLWDYGDMSSIVSFFEASIATGQVHSVQVMGGTCYICTIYVYTPPSHQPILRPLDSGGAELKELC